MIVPDLWSSSADSTTSKIRNMQSKRVDCTNSVFVWLGSVHVPYVCWSWGPMKA